MAEIEEAIERREQVNKETKQLENEIDNMQNSMMDRLKKEKAELQETIQLMKSKMGKLIKLNRTLFQSLREKDEIIQDFISRVDAGEEKYKDLVQRYDLGMTPPIKSVSDLGEKLEEVEAKNGKGKLDEDLMDDPTRETEQ